MHCITTLAEAIDFILGWHQLSAHYAAGGFTLPSRLPMPLRTLYARLGTLAAQKPSGCNDQRPPLGAEDVLVHPQQLVAEEGFLCVVHAKNHSWQCITPLVAESGAVYSNYGRQLTERREFPLVCDSLERFLITFCLKETVLSAPFVYCGSQAAEPLDQLHALWLDGPYLPGQPYSFYLNRAQSVLYMQRGEQLWYATRRVQHMIELDGRNLQKLYG